MTTEPPIDLDVFGRRVRVERDGDRCALYLGNDGKRRPAPEIVVPPDLPAAEVERHVADLCHEWATPRHPEVRRR
ncbi:MAG: hypothetical protein H6983_06105 [Ectothiorhodospiraceae bacterium]|nr:hypothetical protein [Ectothiorhodospiraceae bacterium]